LILLRRGWTSESTARCAIPPTLSFLPANFHWFLMRDNADTGLRSAGGPKVWREMQQRQLEFYQGFDQRPPAETKDEDNEPEPEYSQVVRAHLEGVEEPEKKADEGDETVSFCVLLFSLTDVAYFDSRSLTWVTCCGA
jgi:hypothetical protein